MRGGSETCSFQLCSPSFIQWGSPSSFHLSNASYSPCLRRMGLIGSGFRTAPKRIMYTSIHRHLTCTSQLNASRRKASSFIFYADSFPSQNVNMAASISNSSSRSGSSNHSVMGVLQANRQSISQALWITFAILTGMMFGLVWRNYEIAVEQVAARRSTTLSPSSSAATYTQASLNDQSVRDTHYDEWLLKTHKLRRVQLTEEEVHFGTRDSVQPPPGSLKHPKSGQYLFEDRFLFEEVPILCMVFGRSHKGVRAAAATWTKHCNSVLFFGTFTDKLVPMVKLPPVHGSASHVLFCRAFLATWSRYSNYFKWILITDDETFAVVENARAYVAPLNHSHPYFLGRAIAPFSNHLYNAPESGILLSHGAVAALHKVWHNDSNCEADRLDHGVGKISPRFELSLAIILSKFGALPLDTRDTQQGARFLPFPPEFNLIPGQIPSLHDYWLENVFKIPQGAACCSDVAITFHGINPTQMYLMEYLLYHMAVFGDSEKGLGNQPPPPETLRVRSDLDPENAIDPMVNLIEVGVAHVSDKKISSSKDKYKKKNKKKKKKVIHRKN